MLDDKLNVEYEVTVKRIHIDVETDDETIFMQRFDNNPTTRVIAAANSLPRYTGASCYDLDVNVPWGFTL